MAGSSLIGLAWQEIRPRSPTDRTSGDIFLSLAVSRDGVTWTTHPRVFGPIHYTGVTEGSEPRVYSMAMDARDRILVAVAIIGQGNGHPAVHRPGGELPAGPADLLAGRQSACRISSSRTAAVSCCCCPRGRRTRAWPRDRSRLPTAIRATASRGRSLLPFVTAADGVGQPQLQPSHATFQGREYVVFESLTVRTDLTSTWQLFVKRSSRRRRRPGTRRAPDVREDPVRRARQVFGADPLASTTNGRGSPRWAASSGWSGSARRSDPTRPQIWSARLDAEGALTGAPEIVAADTPSRFAHVLQLRGQEYVLYADGSTGTSRITLAQKGHGPGSRSSCRTPTS